MLLDNLRNISEFLQSPIEIGATRSGNGPKTSKMRIEKEEAT